MAFGIILDCHLWFWFIIQNSPHHVPDNMLLTRENILSCQTLSRFSPEYKNIDALSTLIFHTKKMYLLMASLKNMFIGFISLYLYKIKPQVVCASVDSAVKDECLYLNYVRNLSLEEVISCVCVCVYVREMKWNWWNCVLSSLHTLTGAVITLTFFLFLLQFVKLQLGASLIYASNSDSADLMCLLFRFFAFFYWSDSRKGWA